MTSLDHKQHRTGQRRSWGGSVAAALDAAHSPVAFNKHQDWPALRGRAGFPCTQGFCVDPPSTGRGLTRSGLFSRSRCARRSLDAAPGRFARDPLIGRTVCKFVRAVMAARCLCVPEHFDCQVSNRSERHVRLSKFVSFNADEPTEMTSGTILYQYGEILKVQGAPQHEFG